jgi:hypothetical protein
MNKTRVVYACDTLGDHKAQFVKLIDTDERMLDTAEEALLFGTECTECLNLHELVDNLGEENAKILLSAKEEPLLLDYKEFEHLKSDY